MSNVPETGRFYAASTGGSLRQCEVLSDLVVARPVSAKTGDAIEVELVTHPYAVVISQDCDLDLDFIARNSPENLTNPSDKKIPAILFCEAVTAADLKAKLSDGQVWKRIVQNKDERYHYLRAADPDCDALAQGFPDLGLDFKRYFAITSDHVYLQIQSVGKRRARLLSPYLEHLSTRFAHYLSRVALPEEHLR